MKPPWMSVVSWPQVLRAPWIPRKEATSLKPAIRVVGCEARNATSRDVLCSENIEVPRQLQRTTR